MIDSVSASTREGAPQGPTASLPRLVRRDLLASESESCQLSVPRCFSLLPLATPAVIVCHTGPSLHFARATMPSLGGECVRNWRQIVHSRDISVAYQMEHRTWFAYI